MVEIKGFLNKMKYLANVCDVSTDEGSVLGDGSIDSGEDVDVGGTSGVVTREDGLQEGNTVAVSLGDSTGVGGVLRQKLIISTDEAYVHGK